MPLELILAPNEHLETAEHVFALPDGEVLGHVGQGHFATFSAGKITVTSRDNQTITTVASAELPAVYPMRGSHCLFQDPSTRKFTLIDLDGQTVFEGSAKGLVTGADFDPATGRLGLLVLLSTEDEEDGFSRTDAVILDVATSEMLETIDLDGEISTSRWGEGWMLFLNTRGFVAYSNQLFFVFEDGMPSAPIVRHATDRNDSHPNRWLVSGEQLLTIEWHTRGVCIYDLATMDVVASNEEMLGKEITIATDGSIIATTEDAVRIWNVTTNETKETAIGLSGHPYAFSLADGETIVSMSPTGQICRWRLPVAANRTAMHPLQHAAWSPDHTAVAVCDDAMKKRVGLVDITTGNLSWFDDTFDQMLDYDITAIRWRSATEILVFVSDGENPLVLLFDTSGRRIDTWQSTTPVTDFAFIGSDSFVISTDSDLRVIDFRFQTTATSKLPAEHNLSSVDGPRFAQVFDEDYSDCIWDIVKSEKVAVDADGGGSIDQTYAFITDWDKDELVWYDLEKAARIDGCAQSSVYDVVTFDNQTVVFLDDGDLYFWRSGACERIKEGGEFDEIVRTDNSPFALAHDCRKFVIIDAESKACTDGEHPIDSTSVVISDRRIFGFDETGLFWAFSF